jgi:hypothetical protein
MLLKQDNLHTVLPHGLGHQSAIIVVAAIIINPFELFPVIILS